MLINPEKGSYFFIGALLLDLDLPRDSPFVDDRCGSCTACLDVCPTGALLGRNEVGAPVMDARRCISYLTIELRGAIPRDLRSSIGNRVFGCDICQEVCPHNQPTVRTASAAVEPTSGTRHAALPLLEVLNWSEAERIAAVGGTSATRAKLDMWRRNAAIAMRNQTPDAATAANLDAVAADVDEVQMVRDAAAS